VSLPSLPDFLVTFTAFFLLAFGKGAFGGGLGVLGIPLMALTMPPLTAGGLMAGAFVIADMTSVPYLKPSTWSKPDALILVPTLLIGIAGGVWLIAVLNAHWIEIVMAVTTLAFAIHWFLKRGPVRPRSRSNAVAAVAGLASGVTTMIAHAGGPPISMYLLAVGLPKTIYAGTLSIVFTFGNIVKLTPWLLLAPLGLAQWTLFILALPAIPLGIWLGWRLHNRLDAKTLFALCNGLLVVVSLKLLASGVGGLVE
jgi:uncharacterized membrane protein YfcA